MLKIPLFLTKPEDAVPLGFRQRQNGFQRQEFGGGYYPGQLRVAARLQATVSLDFVEQREGMQRRLYELAAKGKFAGGNRKVCFFLKLAHQGLGHCLAILQASAGRCPEWGVANIVVYHQQFPVAPAQTAHPYPQPATINSVDF